VTLLRSLAGHILTAWGRAGQARVVFVTLLACVGPCPDTPVLPLLKAEPLSVAVRRDGRR
jgi:hypothetical protein